MHVGPIRKGQGHWNGNYLVKHFVRFVFDYKCTLKDAVLVPTDFED